MAQNKFEISPNSLFVKSIINCIYLCIELIIGFCLCNFTYNIPIWNAILFISIILIGEIYRRDNDFNIKILNTIYKWINKLKKEPYVVTDFVTKILNIVFLIFFIYQLLKINYNSSIFNIKYSNIFQVVSIVITVSSIVLTLLYTALQQFENKYSDFGSLIKKWKNTSISSFIILATYTVTCFIFYFYGSNNSIDLLIMASSIYVLLKLILTAINVSLLMNFEIIIRQYGNDLIKLITSLQLDTNYISNKFNVNRLINEIYKKGFKNYIKYKLWGINKKIHYTLSQETIKMLEEKFEPIFRMSEYLLKENNLNNFKCCIDSIYKISVEYSKKYREGFDTSIYNYMAKRVKDLYMLSLKLNYQTFPEYIVEVNEKIGLLSINTKKEGDLYHTIQTTAPNAFLENNYKFIICSLNLEDTSAPVTAIRTFDKYAQKFIYNNSTDSVLMINNKIDNIVSAIYRLNNKKVVTNNIWCIYLINISIISIINILCNLISYKLTEQNQYDINYVLKNTINLFNKSFEILTTYKTYSGDFTNIFYSLGIDTNLDILTKILNESPHIETPYRNSILNNNPLYINKINSLNNIFNVIFVSDFIENYNFEYCILNLKQLLEIYVTSSNRLIETENYTDVKMVISAFSMIQNYIILFINRIKNTEFHRKELLVCIHDFTKNYYLQMSKIIKLCSNIDLYKTLYSEELVFFAINTMWLYYNDDNYKDIIFDLFNNIISIHNDIADDRNKLELFKALNLITLLCSNYDKRSKLFKMLIKFIRNNIPKEKISYEFDFDGTERNFLPHFSSHFGIKYQEIYNYSKLLNN